MTHTCPCNSTAEAHAGLSTALCFSVDQRDVVQAPAGTDACHLNAVTLLRLIPVDCLREADRSPHTLGARFWSTAPYRQSITEWGVRLSLSPPSFHEAAAARCPKIWHQMALCRPVPGDNRDRSGSITTHYLLIILVWSADPAVCVSGWRGEPVAPGGAKILPTFPHPSLGMDGEGWTRGVQKGVGG